MRGKISKSIKLFVAMLFLSIQMCTGLSGNLAMLSAEDLPQQYSEPVALQSVIPANEQGVVDKPYIIDVNKDRKLDVVSVEYSSYRRYLVSRLGAGDGTFGVVKTTPLPTDYEGVIGVTDVNGDGLPDALSRINSGGHSVIEVRHGLGDGTFTSSVVQKLNLYMNSISTIVSDMNGDGFDDIVAAGSYDGANRSIVVSFGDGAGHFAMMTPQVLLVGQRWQIVNTADYTDDGKKDVLVSLSSGHGVIFAGDGVGGFTQIDNPLIYPVSSYGAAVPGDFTNDGKTDIAVSLWGTNSTDYSLGLRVFKNLGGGVYDPNSAQTYNAQIVSSVHLASADVNNDGNLDLIGSGWGSWGATGIVVYVGNGHGQLKFNQRLSLNRVGPTAVGDIDGDSNIDLVLGWADGSYSAANNANAPLLVMHANTQRDTVVPVVQGVPVGTADANGWYDNDVTINWTATDSAPSRGTPTQPPATIATQEGEHTYTSQQSCDPAGNCATGSVTLKIDKSAPAISYTVSQQPNAAGWNNGAVTVSFACSDPGGIQECTAPVTVAQEGSTTVTGRAVDRAGKVTTIQVPIKLDTTKPVIRFTALSNGWITNNTSVAYQCVNDDGSVTDLTAPILIGPDGKKIATGTCTDDAGNETVQTLPVKVDDVKPVVDFQLSQPVNALGWSTGPVTVTFQCDDPVGDGGAEGVSGIDTCTDPVTVTAEGTTIVSGIARDKAGNTTEVIVFVNIDSVKPTLDYEITSDRPAVNGWYVSPVTVSFTCSDATSGVRACPESVRVESDGVHDVAVQAVDVAGNIQAVNVPIRLDITKPEIDFALSPTPNAAGWNNGAVTVSFACSDQASGIASCTNPITVDQEGVTIVTGTAVDAAGHYQEVNVFVNIDKSAPSVQTVRTPEANTYGWNNTDVTLAYMCQDEISLVAVCPDGQPVSTEGANQVVAALARDNAGNSYVTTTTVSIDKTAPLAGAFAWQTNPKTLSASTSLTVPYTEAVSGIAKAEYYIGETDPGLGNGATMQVSGTDATVGFGTDFASGVYKITVRAMDRAGNWSVTKSDYLVVYNPTGYQITGKADKSFKLNFGAGSNLPFIGSGTPIFDADYGIAVQYGSDGQLDAKRSDFQFAYQVGEKCNGKPHAENCHSLELNATTISWFVTQGINNSVGTFSGAGSLSIDGVQQSVTFTVSAVDGARVSGTAQDSVEIKIYPLGADTANTQPMYMLSSTLVAKNGITIK